MTRFPRAIPHLAATLVFIALALAWSFPLAAHLSTHISGAAGDNLAFLWNAWWMREAVARADINFFHADRLFAPFGIDLTLHTHTALPSWLAATVLAPLPIVTAQNLVVLASLALNGFAAYLLAVDRTSDRAAGMVAGVIFAASPYVAAHLFGHVNLVCAWGIPLFLLFFFRALERGSVVSSVAAGLCVVATAFTDYYYLVYIVILGAGLATTGLGPITWSFDRRPIAKPLLAIVMTLLAIDAALVGAVLASGGFEWTVGNVVIRAHRPTNLLVAAWVLIAVLVVIHYRPRLSIRPVPHELMLRRAGAVWPMVATATIGLMPIVVMAWSLWQSGDYTAPRLSWRSGPGGVDLASFVLGNPWHPLWGGWTRDIYARLGINPIESVGWLGVAPLGLVVYGVIGQRHEKEIRRWLAIGGLSLLWALGPWLRVAGFDTGLLLPQNILALVPILSNARIPGRAMVIVFLAVAMIAARVIAGVPGRRRWGVIAGVLALTLIDYVPAPFPLTEVTVPGLYREVRDSRDGAVCELPIGLRDGFGTTGLFDDRTLSYQMVHGHPIVGGFAARIPDSIKKGYEELPVVRSLFRLSAGAAPDPRDMALTREAAGAALQQATIEFIVLNRATAPAPLLAYVESALPLDLVTREGQRDLYVVYTPLRNAFMNGSATLGVGTDSPSSTSRDVTLTP